MPLPTQVEFTRLYQANDQAKRLARKRTPTRSRYAAKPISSQRFGMACARRAPSGATQLEIGAIATRPIAETKPNDSGGNRARCGSPAAMYPNVPANENGTPIPARVATAPR